MEHVQLVKVQDGCHRWSGALSPGWGSREVYILKLCLMKYGVGQWGEIMDSGLLPGKLIHQLNGQTQRLLGLQSLAGTCATSVLV